MIFVIIKCLFGFFLLPFVLSIFYDTYKDRKANKKKFPILYNTFFYILIVTIAIGIVVEINSSNNLEVVNEKKLYFMSLDVYKAEIDLILNSSPSQPTSQTSNELIRKFQHAVYAWEQSDYKESKKALRSLIEGKDNFGILNVIPTYSVYNNLGCVYFKIQRNKDFKAYDYLKKSLSLSQNNPLHTDYINENIFNLNEMVNKLD